MTRTLKVTALTCLLYLLGALGMALLLSHSIFWRAVFDLFWAGISLLAALFITMPRRKGKGWFDIDLM